MCPSETFQLPVNAKESNLGTEVFVSETGNPCSIAIKDHKLAENVKIQVRRDNADIWKDYEEGELLIGKNIKCRLAHKGGIRKIEIEVFHA